MMTSPQSSHLNTMDVDKIIKLADSIWQRRKELDSMFGEMARYIFPERAGFGGSTQAERDAIFDATPEEANATLAAALHSLLTNPASAWFNLVVGGAGSEALGNSKNSGSVGQWISQVQRNMLDVFNDPATGFGNEVNGFYLDLGTFGWGVFVTEDEAGEPIRFRALPLYECALAENRHGQVDKLVRRYRMDAADAVAAFGKENVADSWVDKAKNDPLGRVDISHLVVPIENVPGAYKVQNGQGRGTYQYASLYLDVNARTVLHAGGFYEFPFQVPRWSKANGDVYGRGPGWMALPDIRVLNAVSEAQLMAAEKQADPPLLVPDDGVLGKIRTFAGGVTYYRPNSGDIMPLPMASDLATMQTVRQEKQDAIRRAFLNDRILLAGGPQMTATEVVSRENKQMLVLGPVLGRLQSEFLGPLVERVFGILMRRGALPEAPAELAGKELQVRYVSPIARAQKQVEAAAFAQAMQFLSPVLQLAPQVADLFNTDTIGRDSQELFGYPAKYLLDEKTVEKLRQARQAQQQEQAAMAQMQQMAQISIDAGAMEQAGANPVPGVLG